MNEQIFEERWKSRAQVLPRVLSRTRQATCRTWPVVVENDITTKKQYGL